ncbi:MAG: hypothetical protein AAF490_32410 [Chloroflexota bacterium]
MIAPLKSLSEFSKPVAHTRSNLTLTSLFLGLIFGISFSLIWSELGGLPQIALWPLGFALAFGTVSLIASRRLGKMRWDLLFVGQILGVVGAVLFFFATL